MGKQQILDILETTGAYLKDGHFVLVSRNHTDSYVHVRLALAYPEHVLVIGQELAAKFQEDQIDVVLGFTLGGIELAESVARELDARLVRAESKEGRIAFRKGYTVEPGENALIVDDVLTTGHLIEQAIQAIRKNRGVPRGVGIVVDRGLGPPDFGVRTVSLARIDMNLWPPESCPKCAQGIPKLDLSAPDTKPLAILESLPEESRPILAIIYSEYLEELNAGKPLADVLKVSRPTHELSGKKPERVAILGSFKRLGMMIKLGKFVAGLGCHAVTSQLLFEKNTGKARELRPYPYETMNDFLKRMIYGCQFIVVTYTDPGGQYI